MPPLQFGRQSGYRYFPELGPEEPPETEEAGGGGDPFGGGPTWQDQLGGLLGGLGSWLGGLGGGGSAPAGGGAEPIKRIQAMPGGSFTVYWRGYPVYETMDQNEAERVYNGVSDGPAPGTYQIVDPDTGKGYVIGFDGNTPKIIDEIVGSGISKTPTQNDLEAALKAGIITQDEYNQAVRDRFLGQKAAADQAKARLDAALAAGTISQEEYNSAVKNLALYGSPYFRDPNVITPYQQAQLDLDRQRFGLQQEQFGLQKQQAAIGASRAGNPLAYFGLTTGATPQEALNQVPLAPFQSQIRMGGPVGRPYISGPGNETAPEGYRAPGVQAQARMTPLQTAMNQERNAVEFGVPEVEQQAMEDKVRKGFFGYGGLRGLSFGGTAR